MNKNVVKMLANDINLHV